MWLGNEDRLASFFGWIYDSKKCVQWRIHGNGIFTYRKGWFWCFFVGKYTSRMDSSWALVCTSPDVLWHQLEEESRRKSEVQLEQIWGKPRWWFHNIDFWGIHSLKVTVRTRKRSYSNHPLLGAMLVSGRVLQFWITVSFYIFFNSVEGKPLLVIVVVRSTMKYHVHTSIDVLCLYADIYRFMYIIDICSLHSICASKLVPPHTY